MPVVTLGEVIAGAKSDSSLGIGDRDRIIGYIRRALEMAIYQGNYDATLDTLDVTSDPCGVVTLPYFVGTVLSVNVCGSPTIFRNSWYQYHVNGMGQYNGYGLGGGGGYGLQGMGRPYLYGCGFSDDAGWSPVFQDLIEWSIVAAICEDATDGNGSLKMIVEGETMDSQGNIKAAITIPTTGPSSSGIEIPLVATWANTDAAVTYMRKINRVTKPVTRGYVKLIAFPMRQLATAVTLGYYAPHETAPLYRRISVGTPCKWVRIKYRKAMLPLVNDYDIVPISSLQAMLLMVKAVRLSDSENFDRSEACRGQALRILDQIQSVESGSTYSPMQVEPGFSIGTLDPR